MPRGVILLREDPEFGEDVEEKLLEIAIFSERCNLEKAYNFSKNNHVIVEYCIRCFGWADFLILLWAPNVETIKKAVLKIRELCKVNGKLPQTTTIIGVESLELNSKILKKICEIEEETDDVFKEQVFNLYLEDYIKNLEEKIKKLKKLK